MKKLYRREEIIPMFYSEYEEMEPAILDRIIKRFLRWNEQDFIEYVNGRGIFIIEPVIKNRYFIR